MQPTGGFTLGIDTFAYHRYFGDHTRWESPLDTPWTTTDFVARAHQLEVDAVSLQTCYLPPRSELNIDELKMQLGNLVPVLAWGHPDGLQGGTSLQAATDLMQWFPTAAGLGCTLMRFVAGNQFFFHDDPATRITRLVPLIREAAQEAALHGLHLALENHADFIMADLLNLVEQVDLPNLGICLDTGNAARVGDDPLAATRLAAPLVKMVHLKDLRVQAASRGDPTAWWPSAPLGQGDFDIPAILSTLNASGYHGGLFVELAPLHSNWHNEDEVVAESLVYLRRVLASTA